ncbi:kinase-like domain-containing protein [Pilobolus umbonatus]|nr:kinase-like domain-containing protein [Pilobolus umbonatus]
MLGHHLCDEEHRQDETIETKYGLCQETVGKGTSGIVRLSHTTDKVTGNHRIYAIKELRKQHHETSRDYVNRLISEYYIAKPLRHINLVRTYDLLPLNDTSPIFCNVMEYCGGGDLFQLLYESPDAVEVAEAHCFFKQLIHGVHYLHSIGVAHRDLKPENLLLTTRGCLKISDFGCAVCFKGTKIDRDGTEEEDDENVCHRVKGLVGSEPYIAPEQFNNCEYDARAVDIWSCAITYMSMRKPSQLWRIAKREEDDGYDKYLRFRELLEEERENARKASSKKVIYRMLDPNPNKRITVNDLLQSEWFNQLDCCQPPL